MTKPLIQNSGSFVFCLALAHSLTFSALPVFLFRRSACPAMHLAWRSV